MLALTASMALPLLAGCSWISAPEAERPTETPALTAAAPMQQTAQPGETGGIRALTERALASAGDTYMLAVNVGKADAILLARGGSYALIDTGTEGSVPMLLGALRAAGVTTLDMAFLTHTHGDHIGGLPALGERMEIGSLYAAKYSQNKKNGDNKITLLAEEAGLPLTRLSAGETVQFADTLLTVLGPLAMNEEDDNDNSLVLRWTVNGRTFLLAGDMQFAEEQTLLDAGAVLSADVLKIGNHGNPDATSGQFAQAVSPAIGVISTDTGEDADSANPAVVAALGTAEVYSTEGTPLGVCVAVDADGALAVFAATRPETALPPLTVTGIDRQQQIVFIQNDGETTADLSGCMLLSERGGELFVFPAGSELAPRQTAALAASGGTGDYTFADAESPWHKKKSDRALLYDPYGAFLSDFAYDD